MKPIPIHNALLLALWSPLVIGAATKTDPAADRAAIDAAYTAWVQAVNAHDIEQWMTFLAPDPKFYPPGEPALLGREAVRAFYVELFRDPKFKLRCDQHHIEFAASGEVAWSLGACEATFTDPKDGREGHGKSRWVKVWKKQPNGEWKCEVNFWNYEPAESNVASTDASRTIAVDGAQIHVRMLGNGPPLLLLHGFMCSGKMWERFAGQLGRDHTLVIPDFPGHGYSTGMPAVWSNQQAARQMFALLDQLGLKHVSAIGVSLGADTLLHMALQQSERINAMVLISASHRFTEESRQALRSLPPIEELTQYKDWNRQHNPRGDVQASALLALLRKLGDNHADFSTPLGELAKIPARVLLATGERDRTPSLETQLELHRTLKHSSLWVVPNAGHAPFWSDFPGASAEAEKQFADVVLNFLRDRPTAEDLTANPR